MNGQERPAPIAGRSWPCAAYHLTMAAVCASTVTRRPYRQGQDPEHAGTALLQREVGFSVGGSGPMIAELPRTDVAFEDGLVVLRIRRAAPELTTGRRAVSDPKSRAGKRVVVLPSSSPWTSDGTWSGAR